MLPSLGLSVCPTETIYFSLSATSHINCIVACCPGKNCLSHFYHVMMVLHFLNDVANDSELTQKLLV